MRKLLLLACLSMMPSLGAILPVTSAHTCASSANTSSVTTGAITSGGNLGVIYLTATAVATPTDSKSNTWTKLATSTSNSNSAIYYSINPTVGASHTFSVTAGFPSLCVAFFSGAAAYDNREAVANNTGSGGTTSLATGNIIPTQDGDLIVTGVGGNPLTGHNVSNGFTITDAVGLVGGVSYGSGIGYLIQGTAASIGTTWSWTGSADAHTSIAAFTATTAATRHRVIQ